MTRFSGQARLKSLRRRMRELDIQALLITRRENIRYLTGFTGSSGCVLIAPGKTCLVTDFRYQVQAHGETTGITVVIQKKDLLATAADVLKQRRGTVLWFEGSDLTYDRVRALKKEGLVLKPAQDLVEQLRIRKDAGELALIKTAISRAEAAFLELKPYVRPGATEQQLALILELLMREKGARKAAFDTIVASGRNGAMPHASASERRLRRGDLVTIDFGAEAGGYFSDITRTVCVGDPTSRQRRLYDLVLKAQQAAIAAISPGATCRSIDAAARDIIVKAGHGDNFGHATGHGVGLQVHEAPTVSFRSKQAAAAGMVFTVEPGVYVSGWGGIRIEDMVLVTTRGAEVLTSLPKTL